MAVDLDDLLTEFTIRGYTWKIDGEDRIPTVEDLRQVLDRAKTVLYDEPVPSQLEVGRLIIMRWDENKFDVYLQIGEENA